MRYLIAVINIMVCSLIGIAQDTPVHHWDFDGADAEFMGEMRGTNIANVSDGIKGFGVYLDGQKAYFEPKGTWTDDFSLAFWVKPTSVGTAQTIFTLEKIVQKTGKTERFFHLFLQNGQLFLNDEKGSLDLQTKAVEEGEWHQVMYRYDGFEVSIYWQGEKVFSSGKVTLYNQLAQRKEVLSIGKPMGRAKHFEGVLDEVEVFNRPIKPAQIQADLATKMQVKAAIETELPAMDTIKKVTPAPKKVEKVTIAKDEPAPPARTVEKEPFPLKPKKKDAFFKEEFNGRANDTQHEVYVTATNIEVEVWDYDEFDEDKISITLNNSPFIGIETKNKVVQKKRNKETYRFNLVPETTNYLTFIAEDMGIYDSQNTAAVRIIVNGERFDDVYKLVLGKKKNAVIKLVHVPLNENKPTIVPIVQQKESYKIIVENQILDPLIVNSTAVKLRVKGNKENRKKLQVKVDEKPIAPPFYVTNTLTRHLVFNISTQKEKILFVEALELPQGDDFTVTLEVVVEDKVVGNYYLELDKNNVLLPLVYVPNESEKDPKNERVVVVTDTSLIIQIKDNSKVDGDMVTIRQDGLLLLENYTLTGDFKDLPVKIKANQQNTFVFTPVSMGRTKGENTAYVMIWSKGEIIHEFSLRSQDKNRPAKLIIQHENADNQDE